jgi:dihydrofolate reductase
MAKLVFAMNQSLDGYVDHQAFVPGVALFRHWIQMVGGLTGSLYGRGLYQIMRYWDGTDPTWGDDEHAFADVWRRQPKWVVSRSLTDVGPKATLVKDEIGTVARRLKADFGGEIAVGGPVLAHSLTELGLIDEYRIYLRPYVLGQGAPFFAGPRPPLRLAAQDLVGEDALRLTYVSA